MEVKIKKLVSEAVMPFYAKKGDAGMDLTAITYAESEEKPYIEYGTGLAVEIPEGYIGLIFPRSSISKYDLSLANSVGVIDSGYRGEIICRFKHYKFESNYSSYKVGDKIAQLIIMKLPFVELTEVEQLSETERNTGGFGHSGN